MGVRKYRNNFAAIATALPQALADARRDSVEQLKDVQYQTIDVDTGAARDTIRDDLAQTGGPGASVSHVLVGDPSARRRTDGRPVDYVPFINKRTKFVPKSKRAVKHKQNVKKQLRALFKRFR